MSAAAIAQARLPARYQGPEPCPTTLLELVGAVCDVTGDDEEVVATVVHMIATGRVQLTGNFRGRESDF